MSSRYRFYQWSVSPKRFDLLRKRLLEASFSEETGYGARLVRVADTEIEGRFIQKFLYEEQEFSPSGAAATVERTGFAVTSFILRPTPCGLVIVDPPRSVSSFMMFISTLLEHEVSVQAPTLNLMKFKRLVQSAFGRCRVSSVKISGALLAENVIADIAVMDSQDALDRALDLYPQHKACIGKIEIVLPAELGSRSRLIVGKNGAIGTSLPRSNLEALWTSVEGSLQKK
ncbi:hypothetical protein [Stenotrophomonas cyclobalanopsidis]|uniref:hypothetical protein n=1 Tax=Stenotrophomonas cyclobalanopsidis TaxID=2771362 RepID=UPI0028B0AF94|nr:hypothetical protein [Stenotrophomonas cyclobalanopsidis]